MPHTPGDSAARSRIDLPCSPERAHIRPPPEAESEEDPMNGGIRDVSRELLALGRMSMAALRAKYRDAFGEETTSHNAPHLRKKIAWRIQELAQGGVTERAQARIKAIQETAPLRERPPARAAATTAADAAEAVERVARDPALPAVGSVLRKEHRGATHEVTVAAGGFVYRGKTYTSLSTIAKAITGTTWNGRLFFGLTSRKRKEAA